MGEWREVKLGDLGVVITGKTPSKKNPEDWGNLMPFVTPSDYKNYRKFALSSDRNLSSDGIERLIKKVLAENSIMVTCIGSDMGKVSVNSIPVITNQQINSIISNNKIVDNDFLYYRLVSMYNILRIYGSDGTAVPIINKNDFENLETTIPDLKEQKAIAQVLSSLDDKIDLLHRQNKTLEELAQTLFRQWFIEEAKDEWEEVKLSEVLEIKYGKNHKKLANGNIPLYGSGGIMRYVDSFLYDKESILIPRKGTLTNLFYINEPFWTVDTLFWSKINNEKASGKFLFFFLKTMDLSNLNVGSAVPSLTTKVLNEIKLLLPSLDEQKQFNKYADSAWEKMAKNKEQIKTLEKMRDTLLPKLMSGEVKVKL